MSKSVKRWLQRVLKYVKGSELEAKIAYQMLETKSVG